MPTIFERRTSLADSGMVIRVQLSAPRNVADGHAPLDVAALIDTGANSLLIKTDIVERLGLKPIGSANVNTPLSRNHQCQVYHVRLILPENISLEVAALALPMRIAQDCAIGRDVLSRGTLIYDGVNNTFSLIF